MKRQLLILLIAIFSMSNLSFSIISPKSKALIITGQNNHNWKASSPILKQLLDQTGLFSSDIATSPEKKGDMSNFNPDFSKYNVVILDYNGDSWNEKTKTAFLKFVKDGGGVVVYHAADNSFPEWKEYNEIIGIGGWGKRNEKSGPYAYYKNNILVMDTTAGIAGSHGKRSDFLVKTRIADHPITKGLPMRWMHGSDELYSQLRGPAKNMDILATAFANPEQGTGRDEPMLMTIKYGKGRIFHTAMGHADDGGGPAMQCVGFIVTLQRGAEWAASGSVTQEVPIDFPNVGGVSIRPEFKQITIEDDMASLVNYDIGKSTKNYTDLQERMRRSAKKGESLLLYEKLMVKIIQNDRATTEAKKLMLRELSWIGSDYCVPAVKKLVATGDLKDEANYTLARLKQKN